VARARSRRFCPIKFKPKKEEDERKERGGRGEGVTKEKKTVNA